MSVGILYELSETDERGIKLTAEELGIDLVYIPFRKVAIRLGEEGYSIRSKREDYSKVMEGVNVILNRAQSKNRRLLAANVLETFDKYVINPSSIEYICYSKLRTVLHFWKEGIKTPRTIFIPCDSHETTRSRNNICNDEEIADLMQQELGAGNIVIKPDAGTHGRNVRLAEGRNDLLKIIRETEPSIINPLGILAQEFVKKWFYDLRIIVSKENGKPPYCYTAALARAGFKDFRTNTFLGNMVFGVNLPPYLKDVAVKCGKAIGKNNETWLLALDAMIRVEENENNDDDFIKEEFLKLEAYFDIVKKVKSDETKKGNFKNWNKRLEEAFQNYKDQEAYQNIKNIIEKSMESNKYNILFHEANACPEFWEQTRLVAGVNVAVPLLKCAQSVIDSY
jgi:glutathione synthase/RimK-type ligase-like ATP-grasp enzyme